MPKLKWSKPPTGHPDHLHDTSAHRYCTYCGASFAEILDEANQLNHWWELPPEQMPQADFAAQTADTTPLCQCQHRRSAHAHYTTANRCSRCDCPAFVSRYDYLWKWFGLVISVALVIWTVRAGLG